ncbi:Detected protein of unknown function [Hibiscus syriacus]|uniref:Uncharacterized protein n=1 Tax=Hibiscus syriacus TaxID=106335 RepID=A0A6A2Z941_HIBSY|nr:kinetochore protein SLK19-like [Hibiscus syriacus]KAE8688501.1 Detected protein of unknown function [Hibiscus syriacus]
MGKRKVTPQPNDPKHQNPSQETHDPSKDSTFTKSSNPLSRQSSMEDPEEKLQNMRSLNTLLVNEVCESRQMIESLVQAKKALVAELGEKKKLEAEESEKDVSFELQNELFSVYMWTQMEEHGFEMEKMIGALKTKVNGLMETLENESERLSLVCKERDSERKDFEFQVTEGKLMKEKLMEMEGNERKFVEEIRKLKEEYDRLVWETRELEKVKILVMKDKDLWEKRMKDVAEEVGNLRRENEKIASEKKDIEVEKNEQKLKICKMEMETREMNEFILSFRKENEFLNSKIFELEKNYREAMEREAERAIELGALVEEKTGKERSIERLMEEKDFMSRSLEAIEVESEDRQRRIEKLEEESAAARRVLEMNEKELKDMHKKIEELSGDKTEIEKAKNSGENENIELHNEVSELRNVVQRLQEECLDHRKKNNELISEVGCFRDLVDQVTLEKDDALKQLDEEMHTGVNLRSKVSEMENELRKTAEELAQKRTEWQNLIDEKEETGRLIGSMAEDKDRLHEELLEANRSFKELKAKMESTTRNHERAFTLLTSTASLLCQSKDENDQKLIEEDEIGAYAMELEAIKKAFENKETVAQDLRQKVKLTEKSMVETQKKKSFWTLVSSATTLLAAITVAYAARGR